MAKSIAEIQDELTQVKQSISDLGYIRPIAYLQVHPRGDRFGSFVHGSIENDFETTMGSHLYADSVEDLLDKIKAYVSDMPDQNAAVVANFQKSVAQLLERAKDLGLEHKPIEAAINPLTDLMKALSENIITDQSAVAAE